MVSLRLMRTQLKENVLIKDVKLCVSQEEVEGNSHKYIVISIEGV